jgi:hypothetical protein
MAAVNKMKASRMNVHEAFGYMFRITLIVFCFNFEVANVHCRSISMQMEHEASGKACPALALMRSILSWLPKKKARQLRTNLPPKLALRLVLPSFANVNLMNAIFARAWAVAVVIRR